MVTARPDSPRKVAAADFLQFPDDFPPRSQLIRGQVVVTEASLRHQRPRAYIQLQPAWWAQATPRRGEALSPVDVPIDDENVFAPEVLWTREDRRPPKASLHVDSVPDLAVEVRSPSTWRYDIGPKRARYERAGLPELWLVDTESRSVLVYRRSAPERTDFDIDLEVGEGATLTSPMLPGLEIEIADLFDR